MLHAALPVGHRGPALASSSSSRDGFPTGRRYGVVAGVGRALDAHRGASGSTTRRSPAPATRRRRRRTAATGSPTTASPATSGATPRARSTSPARRCWSSRAPSPRRCCWRRCCCRIYNHDSAIASAASRMTAAAGDRPCIEMGSRRTHEQAAVAAARAAYIAGFATTSNLEAGRRYGVPTAGTAAHSFTLLHDTEGDAFRAQVDALGADTTLLVDTYDVTEAVRLGGRGHRAGARRGPARLRRPRRAGPPGPRAAGLARARPTPGSS